MGTEFDPSSVDGVAVVTRTPAHGNFGFGTGEKSFKTVDHLLLENGAETYQCRYDRVDDTVTCNRTWPTTQQVIAHQRTHSPRRRARKFEQRSGEQRERRSTGALAAAVRRRERVVAAQQSPYDALLAIEETLIGLTKQVNALKTVIKTVGVDAVDPAEIARLRQVEADFVAARRLFFGDGTGLNRGSATS